MIATAQNGGDPDRPTATVPASAAVRGAGSDAPRSGAAVRGCLLLALLAFADWLFWGHMPGLSVAVFTAVAAMAIVAAATPAPEPKRAALLLAIVPLCLLPVLHQVQTLSVGFAVVGLGLAAGEAAGRAVGVPLTAGIFARMLLRAPLRAPADAIRFAAGRAQAEGAGTRLGTLVRGWALPAVSGLLFLLLFVWANPVLDRWLAMLLSWDWTDLPRPERLLFWLAVAWMIWPLLVVQRLARAAAARPAGDQTEAARAAHPPRPLSLGLVNPTSVRNSLVLFNLLFALQGGLDGLYLWGNVALPEGLTYADYAHRGAYPLIGAALLAGLFALLARPHLDRGQGLRPLLGLWLAQTVGLVGASAMRLDLYVDAYGLTYLRFWAFFWMALVGAGLALVGAQVALERPNAWLVRRVAGLGAVVLYGACFVNAADRIAEANLARLERGERFDDHYLCGLGPMAAPAILRHEVRTGVRRCGHLVAVAAEPIPWRAWGFRHARVQAYVLAAEAARETGDDL